MSENMPTAEPVKASTPPSNTYNSSSEAPSLNHIYINNNIAIFDRECRHKKKT